MSKREEMRAKRRKQKQIQTAFTIGAVVLGALLVFLFLVGPNIGVVLFPENVPPVVEWTMNERPNASMNGTGDPNAPVKIEEFSDFQCPYCGDFALKTEPLIVENYVKTGKVYFVYRSMGNWISDSMAAYYDTEPKTESRDSAAAVYCAGDQGKFWQMHDGLYVNNLGEDAGSYTEKRLQAIAEKAGLDLGTFNGCMESGKYLDQVAQDAIDGRAAGITGTPAFVLSYTVNGEARHKLIIGAQPFDQFQQEIEAALAEIEEE